MEKNNNKIHILIADDEVVLTSSLKNVLEKLGYKVSVCNRGNEILNFVKRENFHIIFLDIFLGDANGIEILKKIKLEFQFIPVIMITANSDITTAVYAMKEGAYDYITKPFDIKKIIEAIQKNVDVGKISNSKLQLSEIIAQSEEMKNILNMAKQLSVSGTTTVLLQGESGTGKEIIAKEIHNLSQRKNRNFISVNCGAIPKELAESELFGYEKGAFTGASEKIKQGKFELASGGTILLDEIGELNLELQVKLLRVLEEKKIYRLGGTKEIEIDVRIIASSNRNLQEEVLNKRFREDLFYRLNVATIYISPLRERKKDIVPLGESFLKEFSKEFSKNGFSFSDASKNFLENYNWKGNVRELRNAIERVVLLNQPCKILPKHFLFLLSSQVEKRIQSQEEGISLDKLKVKKILRDAIIKSLIETNGNQLQASILLGISRTALRHRIKTLKIDLEQIKG